MIEEEKKKKDKKDKFNIDSIKNSVKDLSR